MLRAGREAGVYQSLLNIEKAATCTSNGGINQTGLPTGTYTSPTFPCGDSGAKSRAIQNLLQQMGYTQTLCSGTCTTGVCKPISLTSGLHDNVDLVLNNDGQGTCWYVATVKPPGTGYFNATCDCICATTTGTGSGSN